MALDDAGNWYPTLPNPPAFSSFCDRNWCVSAGVPSANQGNEGDLVIARSTGAIYEKVDGAWTTFPGYTGSTGSNNLSGSGSPVGVATPDYIGQWYLKKTSPYDVYVSTGVTNTSWLLVVSGLT